MTDKLVERALVRFVADCSDEEQHLPAIQFICNRSPFIADAITKALASSSVPEQDSRMVDALEKAARKFREYAVHHRQKVSAPDRGDWFEVRHEANQDALRKARTNDEMAEMCEAAIAPAVSAPQDRGASQEDGR